MKISTHWLSEYIDHGLSPEDLADALTLSGLEVEELKHNRLPSDEVIVGHVQSVCQHPNADHLKVCHVNLGGDEHTQIVCGASEYCRRSMGFSRHHRFPNYDQWKRDRNQKG